RRCVSRVMQPDPWEFGRIHSCLEPVGDCVRVVRHPELVGSGYRPQTTPRAGNPGGSFTGTQMPSPRCTAGCLLYMGQKSRGAQDVTFDPIRLTTSRSPACPSHAQTRCIFPL